MLSTIHGTTQSQMRFKGNIKLKRLFIENVTMVTLTQPLKLTNNYLPKELGTNLAL